MLRKERNPPVALEIGRPAKTVGQRAESESDGAVPAEHATEIRAYVVERRREERTMATDELGNELTGASPFNQRQLARIGG